MPCLYPGVALLGGLVDLRHLAEINHLVFVGLGLDDRHGGGNGADRDGKEPPLERVRIHEELDFHCRRF